jgi:hypothetical protein
MLVRIDPISLPIPSLQLGPPILPREIGPPLPSLPIAQRTRPEALRKTMAAQAAAIARWVDMSPAEIHRHLATADKPASRETKNPLAHAAMVAAAEMPKAEAVVIEAVAETAAAGIEAAKRKVDEEFQWRQMK